MASPTVLIVPGLRDRVDQHWQTLLATSDPSIHSVPPMGRENVECAPRLEAIERAANAIQGPLILVAHSGGCIAVARWAQQTRREVLGALLAVPPDFESPLPEGYPTQAALDAGGWLPVPRTRLPFRSIVGTSRNDPLGRLERIEALARDWGSELVDLGEVGHLNPASGYGEWPLARHFIERLRAAH